MHPPAGAGRRRVFSIIQHWGPLPKGPFCVMLSRMGSKDKGKKEAKKAPKPKPKPEPSGRREIFTPPPPK